MADYQNTRDTIAGSSAEAKDQAVLEGLVNNTLTELIEDGVAKLRPYAFRGNTALTNVYLPNLTETGQGSFYGCTGLESIDFPKLTSVRSETFNGCSNLKHVIIRTESSAVPTLTSTNAFNGTPILLGEGAIYVPNDMISKYKNHTYWKNFFIADLEDYKLSTFETISDSWDTIVSNPSKYNVGDTKQIDLGTLGKHYMQLVAKEEDVKHDGSGNAPTTWISKTLIATHVMYPSNNYSTSGQTGWESSDLRNWLKTTVKPLIPEPVRSAIITVDKVQSIVNASGSVIKNGQTTTDGDDVWIPSDYEVGLSKTYEDTGAKYDIIFPYGTSSSQNAARVKYYNGSAYIWWLRSAYSSTYFRNCFNSGSANISIAYIALGVALGFCL